MISTKITVGAFIAAALAKSYLNVWGDTALDLALTTWGAR